MNNHNDLPFIKFSDRKPKYEGTYFIRAPQIKAVTHIIPHMLDMDNLGTGGWEWLEEAPETLAHKIWKGEVELELPIAVHNKLDAMKKDRRLLLDAVNEAFNWLKLGNSERAASILDVAIEGVRLK